MEYIHPNRFVVYEINDDDTSWQPALFDHREVAYLVHSSELTELTTVFENGLISGDADVAHLRVVDVWYGDLYAYVSGEFKPVRDNPLCPADIKWFEFN